MSNRFSYVRYDEHAMSKQQELREAFERVESLADGLANGRAKSLVYTALEEAYMWTGKAIRDDQIARQGKVDEQPERERGMKLDFVNDNENAMEDADCFSTLYVRKKPVTVQAFILMAPATFITSSGEQYGNPGDYVIVGKDHAWPVSAEYFKENYEVTGEVIE